MGSEAGVTNVLSPWSQIQMTKEPDSSQLRLWCQTWALLQMAVARAGWRLVATLSFRFSQFPKSNLISRLWVIINCNIPDPQSSLEPGWKYSLGKRQLGFDSPLMSNIMRHPAITGDHNPLIAAIKSDSCARIHYYVDVMRKVILSLINLIYLLRLDPQ